MPSLSSIFTKIGESDILSAIVAGILVFLLGAFLTFLGRKVWRWYRKPELSFIFRQTRNNKTQATIKSNNIEAEYSFRLTIKHNKGADVKDVTWWHLVMPQELMPTVHPLANELPRMDDITEDGKAFVHFFGHLPPPLYSSSSQELSFEFQGSFKPTQPMYAMYYWFRTEYGMYPKGMKQSIFSDLEKFQQKAATLTLRAPSKLL